MHHALGVRGFERSRELLGDVHSPVNGQAPALGDDFVQVPALDVCHGDELHAAYVAQIMNAQNVLV